MKLLFLKLLEKKTRLHNLYRIIFYTGLYIQNFARHVDMQFDQYFFAHKPIFLHCKLLSFILQEVYLINIFILTWRR